jgi:hypothetical protein
MKLVSLVLLAACGGTGSSSTDAGDDVDAASDTGSTVDAPSSLATGIVSNPVMVACPSGVPGATCERVTVSGCPGIENEALDATVGILAETGTLRGTIVHFSGGGGTSFQTTGAMAYRNAGFRQVFVAWASDWEQTAAHGIKAAGCRPATLLKWAFAEPTLHAASRALGFCAEGFSGGSGQLGYALAHYGLGDYLDYVNELSGPPFARIDLGCDGDAPATATVCGAEVTMRLPPKVTGWENIAAPLACGSTGVPATELARWKADSIAFGGTYDYPRTRVEFFDCTNQATAVTGMAQQYYDQVMAAEGGTSRISFHCYTQADGCQGENLGTGTQDAIQAMIAGCTPRHP